MTDAPVPSRHPTPSAPRPMAVVLLALLAPVAVYLAVVFAVDPGPRWRATYYPNRKFEGAGRVVPARDAALEIREDPPLPGLTIGELSVRFETCLRLVAPTRLDLSLSSDDAARLIVDGETLVDLSGKHRRRTKSAELKLPGGAHHVVVEFAPTRRKYARMGLVRAVGKSFPEPLPAAQLEMPAEGGTPCP